jgi:anti-sigma regulatory factor (Ser/Thr protein kinase)
LQPFIVGNQMDRKFKRSFDELKDIVALTEQFFSENDIDQTLRYMVDLAVEELFVNMVTYNVESNEDILIQMSPHEHGIEVSLTDFDVERFDPTEVGPIDIDASAEVRVPGGLGLFLVLKMVDSIHYEYRNRQSKITFIADRR